MVGTQIPSRLALIICLLLLFTGTEGKPRLRRRELSQKDYEYPNHSQSTQHQKSDRCPPPPQMLPERACEVPRCRSDSECERHKRCCYNGCIYACLESVQPPPVLDWLVQPKPRWLGGNGWLLDGPEEVLQAEACSTTEDGDEPLHCPTGYECHIINPGNPSVGIPNRGQCIKQRGNSVVQDMWNDHTKLFPRVNPCGQVYKLCNGLIRCPGVVYKNGRSLRHKYYKDQKDYLGSSSNIAVGYEKHHKHLG